MHVCMCVCMCVLNSAGIFTVQEKTYRGPIVVLFCSHRVYTFFKKQENSLRNIQPEIAQKLKILISKRTFFER